MLNAPNPPSQILKPKPQKRLDKPKQTEPFKLVELPEDSSAVFQAVGIIKGKLEVKDNAYWITIDNKSYQVYCSKTKRNVLNALKIHLDKKSSHPRLIVYPHFKHYPGRNEPYKVSFQLVGFAESEQNVGVCAELQDFEFKMSGLWQFIPVCPTPVVSIFRNYTDERLSFIKQTDVQMKVNFLKSQHLPLFWYDALVKPFRFNPKLDKEQGTPPFIQIVSTFSTKRDAFEFNRLQAMPASNHPRFLKAGKEDKAKALASRAK